MTVERVYLIRHGQTDWNIEGRWQGHEAIPLNETGIQQARALAACWTRPLNAVYTSDLGRAWDTAHILASAFNLVPLADSRLREHHIGIFQGLRFDDMHARFPDEMKAMSDDYMGYTIPDGESRAALQMRAYAAWSDIVASDFGTDVAIVTHGGTIKMLLYKLFGETPEIKALHIENTSITTIERTAHGWTLVEGCVTPHLATLQSDNDPH